MNETAAREVLLVRAIERADTSQSLLSREDREFASGSATELARWGAAEKRAPLDPREFLARRARLLLDKLDERHPRTLRAARAGLWRAPLAALLPPVALLAGALFERLGDTQRINVLALPLLGLVGWNLAVYLVILLGPVLRRLRPGARVAIDRHRAAGEQVVLATTSSQYLAVAAQQAFGLDAAVATMLGARDGVLDGTITASAFIRQKSSCLRTRAMKRRFASTSSYRKGRSTDGSAQAS
jgi:hypothetical protein